MARTMMAPAREARFARLHSGATRLAAHALALACAVLCTATEPARADARQQSPLDAQSLSHPPSNLALSTAERDRLARALIGDSATATSSTSEVSGESTSESADGSARETGARADGTALAGAPQQPEGNPVSQGASSDGALVDVAAPAEQSSKAAGRALVAPKASSGDSSEGATLAGARDKRGILGEVVPTALALGATLLVVVLARSAAKRLGAGGSLARAARPSGVVEVLARYPIARGQQIVLLKVARRVIVVHQGAQGMQTLSVFEGNDEVADVLARCEAGSRNTREFSFDALLRSSGRAFDAPRGSAAAREGDLFASAEIEMVDLTRRSRAGARR